jgi:tetratricopeptide (TPR) repeat protein
VLAYSALRLHRLSKNEAARDTSKEALQIAIDTGDRAAQAYALTTLGHALAGLSVLDDATRAYQEALTIRQELDQHNFATEPQAGLAALSLSNGNFDEAKSQIDAILNYLDSGGKLDGTLEPLRVYVTCEQVLQALKDDRANDVLERANLELHKQAYRIQDQTLKDMFFATEYAVVIKRLMDGSKGEAT